MGGGVGIVYVEWRVERRYKGKYSIVEAGGKLHG